MDKLNYLIAVLLNLPLLLFSIAAVENNACSTYQGYFFIDTSPDCYNIPDDNEDVPEIVTRHVGVSETHQVTTEDGYILTIFRIPRTNPKGVVLLHHPVGVDSKVWVSEDNSSTALLFWRAGYDVWMPNNRGTLYSKMNIYYTPDQPQFWDFSFHELGYYDFKANIDYIRNKTNGERLVFIGHSLATSASLVYASMRPEEARDNLKIIINMAQVAHLKSVKTPIRFLGPYAKLIQSFNEMTGTYSTGAHYAWFYRVLRAFLVPFPFKFLIVLVLCVVQGWAPYQYEPDLINIMVDLFPSEYSYKILYHYAQIYMSGGVFKLYDYGAEKNLQLYGSEIAPPYPLEKIQTPVYLVRSDADYISSEEDVDWVSSQLPADVKRYGELRINYFSHIDFHYGKHRIPVIYEKLLQLISTL